MNNVRFTGMTTLQAARTAETRIAEEQRKIAKTESMHVEEPTPKAKPKKKRGLLSLFRKKQ